MLCRMAPLRKSSRSGPPTARPSSPAVHRLRADQAGAGDIFFLGDLRPGNNSPAVVTFGNNVAWQSSTGLQIEFRRCHAGSRYDQIQVAGDATLAGTLDVDLINGFTPAANSSFTLMTYGSRSGTFDSVLLPSLPTGLGWSFAYGPTSVSLSVISTTPPGDIDLDGDVDRGRGRVVRHYGRTTASV